MVATGCANDGLTGVRGAKAPFPNFFRTSNNDTAMVVSLARVVAEKHPQVTAYSAFGYDYVTGTTEWKLYQQTLRSSGVALATKRETFVPLGEQNFKPYVQALAADAGDRSRSALYLGTYGAGTASLPAAGAGPRPRVEVRRDRAAGRLLPGRAHARWARAEGVERLRLHVLGLRQPGQRRVREGLRRQDEAAAGEPGGTTPTWPCTPTRRRSRRPAPPTTRRC
ncbi:hypothetical protein GCM10025868_09400 [Angustibacter aerolatus]|uniref:Leucine-binding protein domain-containing protein n=1 Tax=Angustibacter aerolatus TaxID=1162965 RepID=A0ABQ6JFT7_9ACTN|nr:ABC transporter substrate-binding protein [Angustibacter aerolatus]GMA85690.1 hypothetical protein GCM10025868_09400 [Angustibacter aerolatus]